MALVANRQDPDQSVRLDLVEHTVVTDSQFPRCKRIRLQLLSASRLNVGVCPEQILDGIEDDPLFPSPVAAQILAGARDEPDIESHAFTIPSGVPSGKGENSRLTSVRGLPRGFPKTLTPAACGGPGACRPRLQRGMHRIIAHKKP